MNHAAPAVELKALKIKSTTKSWTPVRYSLQISVTLCNNWIIKNQNELKYCIFKLVCGPNVVNKMEEKNEL